MNKQGLTIPILGGIFFLVIIIGGAIKGDPFLLVGLVVALLFCSFVYMLRKRRLKEQEAAYLQTKKTLFSVFDMVLIFFVLYFLVALPFVLGILHWRWPLHRH